MKTISLKANKETVVKLNKYALESTEKAVLKTIDKAEELQDFTAKALKSTLEFSEKQQDTIFNSLEKGKKLIWKNVNKTLDFFGKK